MREDRTSLSGIADKACERLLPQQPKRKFLENESPIQNTAVSHQTASPIAATESPDRFSPLPESESTRELATTSIQTNCSRHANEKGGTTAQGYPVSRNLREPVVVPLTLPAVQLLLDIVKEGDGHQLQITFPDPYVQQPFMLIPLEIGSQIMRKYTS
ncbi:predicted protein [Coccidioides posadasii str. Silveira]|uniref:Predicted protein n=2 Tax=Coccidioides posadasii (strain RMSCC 757 / Silveira) TaxID=443226 RepID=E9D516_COCPS|nr:predicted protein [Coccidioides posadasii str. Silveira]